MTLETVYYIGQTIAVVAILASLIAIYFQMQQSTKMERAAAQRDILDRVAEFTRQFGADDFDQLALGLIDFEGASHETQAFIHNKLIELVFITESALNMHKDGFFSEGTWSGIEGAMLGILRTNGGKEFWSYAQNMVGFEIADHLNKRLKEVGDDGPTFLDTIPFLRSRADELSSRTSSQ
ncbi:MAG: hypothetical protein AAGF33_17480 [Pseudomonadota bacterium]